MKSIKINSSSLNPVLSNSADPTDEIMKKMLREADEFQKKLKDDYEDQVHLFIYFIYY